jgi:hypothetical protein
LKPPNGNRFVKALGKINPFKKDGKNEPAPSGQPAVKKN